MRSSLAAGILILSAFLAVVLIDPLGLKSASSGQFATAPAGEITNGLAVDPRDGSLIRATSRGLLRSKDAGRGWTPIPGSGLLGRSGIGQVVVNPDKATVIYAAGMGTGVIGSEDGGAVWRRIAIGLPSTDVEAFAMHAFRRETLYAAVRGRGMYRTEDGGGRWQRMDGGPSVTSVLALVHSPLSGSMNTGWLYAGTPDGPYISMDCF